MYDKETRSTSIFLLLMSGLVLLFSGCGVVQESGTSEPNTPPEGFQALFDGERLDGWWGEKTTNPRTYLDLPEEKLQAKKQSSRTRVRKHWHVEDGVLVNDGSGPFLTTNEFYEDFELRLDYKITPGTDSGVYLRGIPQVQIWDFQNKDQWDQGAKKGSGGLWNNPADWAGKFPSQRADQPPGSWNHLRIVMVGERVTVFLNGERVVDHARLNNYFDRETAIDQRKPVPRSGPIQLQTHGGETRWRNIYIREIGHAEANNILRRGGVDKPPDERFQSLFNGTDFEGWSGAKPHFEVVDGAIQCKERGGGTLYTEEVFKKYVVQMEIRIPPAGNNGLAIHYPGHGTPAYDGLCELQVLDNTAEKFSDLDPRQYHGAAYAQWPAHTGYLREPGKWNFQEVTVNGSHVRVELNGTTILNKDLSTVEEFMKEPAKFEGRDRRKGHFGFAGHHDPVAFRKIRLRELK